jgi:PleD family two-component response regulator
MLQKEVIQGSRILIVDDQPANVLLLERILQQGGYTNNISITDPRQVLQFFTLHQPDLILLDLSMPHLDGFALMTQLRSRIPEGHYLPVLILTADVTPKAKHKALGLGAKDFLTKPFDASEVLLRVYNLLETRWLYAQLQQHITMLEEQSSAGEGSHESKAASPA